MPFHAKRNKKQPEYHMPWRGGTQSSAWYMYLLALVGLPSSSRGMTATSMVSMASLLPLSLDFSLDPCLREKEKVKLEGNRLVPEEPPWLLTSRKRTRKEGMHAAIKQATDSVWSQIKRITSSSAAWLVSDHSYSRPPLLFGALTNISLAEVGKFVALDDTEGSGAVGHIMSGTGKGAKVGGHSHHAHAHRNQNAKLFLPLEHDPPEEGPR